MRLVTFDAGSERPHIGVIVGDDILDLTVWLASGLQEAYSDPARANVGMINFIMGGEHSLQSAMEAITSLTGDGEETLLDAAILAPLTEVVLLAPIPRPPKNVMCLGRNYSEHRMESMRAWGEKAAPPDKPDFPAIFTKAPTAVAGPFSDIPYDPNISTQMDYEVELAVVIGKPGKNIRREDAMQHVFGYMILNDVTARDIQKRHGNQWFKGKSLDGACPTGPWIVTADEIEDPSNLAITLRVNGVEKQRDNTRSMMFDIPEIIQILSEGMTLEAGDIIATGTPAGVGFARTPPEFLHPGDVVECEIEKIGVIRNRVVMSET